jgi:hypothetical protein
MTRRLLSPVAASLPLLLTLAAGCGGLEPCPPADDAFACVDGATLAAPAVKYPVKSVAGLEAQTAKALELAGKVWGVDPRDYLTGWVINFSEGWFACGRSWTYGCADTNTSTLAAAPGPAKCLTGVLVHELGHLVVGDMAHRDPRFEKANALESAPCE